MPSEKTHQAVYVVVFVGAIALLYYFNIAKSDYLSLGVAFVFGLVGSVFPDVDIGTSKIRKRVNIVMLLGSLGLLGLYFLAEKKEYVYAIIGLVVLQILLNFSHHRKFCHSIVFLLLTGGVIYVLFRFFVSEYLPISAFVVALGWGFGMFCHLAADKEIKGWLT